MRRLTEWVRKKGTEETAFAHFVQFTYLFFSNSYIQAIVSIVGTVVIAVMIGLAYYDIWFWVASGFYVVATFLIAWANQHVRQKIKDTQAFQNALYGLGATLRCMAIPLQKCAKTLRNTDSKKRVACIKSNTEIDFQSAAFAVCEKLRDTLSRKEEKDDVYVTVFQKKEENGNSYCKMIAHSAKHEVSGYDTQYPILPEHKEMFGKIEYHTFVFAAGIKEVTSFHTHELVQEAFCVHEARAEREKSIHQYICIPISPAGLGVTFLLQVDTNERGLFGMSKTAVDNFGKNTIYPYAQLLHMIYEQSRVIEQLTT